MLILHWALYSSVLLSSQKRRAGKFEEKMHKYKLQSKHILYARDLQTLSFHLFYKQS